ncbi:MAG: pitrilysin family protein [Pyrinomonadaceae bacterium]
MSKTKQTILTLVSITFALAQSTVGQGQRSSPATPLRAPQQQTTQARSAAVAAPSADIPGHPSQLKFQTLDYTPPKRDKYRHVLSNGAVAYLVEDHDLPLVNVSVMVRTGSYLEPVGKEGLAALTGGQMRSGGTLGKTAEQFDEAADFLAAFISSGIGGTQGSAGLNCLAKDVDQGLGLLFEMLKSPGFQADRLTLAKSQILQGMERRNDSTDAIEDREWDRLMRGSSHFSTRPSTKASIESISRDDMIGFHKKYYHPGALIFAISGDFKTDEMLAKLESSLRGWPVSKEAVPEVPKPDFAPVAGVYVVNKSDVNQGRVTIGHAGTTRDNPDFHALSIMNDILGGGGFSSRILSRVRSDEGLAYSADSSFSFGVYYPGDFRATFQSKSSTTAQAADLVLEEINRIRTAQVSVEELQRAQNYATEIFPRFFATPAQIAGTFAQDEYTRRPADFWDKYRERVRAVTAADILRVAQKYLQPEQLMVLVVGNIDDITKGNPDRPQHLARQDREDRHDSPHSASGSIDDGISRRRSSIKEENECRQLRCPNRRTPRFKQCTCSSNACARCTTNTQTSSTS